VTITRRDDGTPLPAVLELEAGTGVYVDIQLSPQSTLPTMHHGLAVQKPDDWALGWRYNLTNRPELCTCCGIYRFAPGRNRPPSHKRGVLYGRARGGPGYHWEAAGFTWTPDPPANIKSGEFRYWTFLTGPPDGWTGTLTYEICAHPATHIQKTSGLTRWGERAPLWRGQLRVVERVSE
jgi:hypothetical protein